MLLHLRLWIDAQIFERQHHGGVSRVWEHYIDELAGLGTSILLTASNDSNNRAMEALASIDNVETLRSNHRVRPISIFDRQALRTKRLRTLAKGWSPCVFQSTWDSSLNLPYWPEVMMIHDMIPELFFKPRRSLFQAQVLASRRHAIRNATRLVAVSENTAHDLVSIYPDAASRTSIITHGPPLSASVQSAPIKDLLSHDGRGFDPGDFYLFVGKRSSYKNFRLVRSLIETSQKHAVRGLICVGGSPPSPEELHPRIAFVPYVSDSELAGLYESARALVYPSLYEGFGLPILEAMIRGCPVVSSDAASMPEVGGEAAVYFDPHSAEDLARALGVVDDRGRTELGALGRENLRRFSWAASAQRLLDIYQAISP